jgi:Zn-finger domain-containing protein
LDGALGEEGFKRISNFFPEDFFLKKENFLPRVLQLGKRFLQKEMVDGTDA